VSGFSLHCNNKSYIGNALKTIAYAAKNMFTRQDYMTQKVTHRQYYAQFVTPQIKDWVEKRFGAEKLKKSYDWDVNLNNIPLFYWDPLATQRIISNIEFREMLRLAGDGMSLAGAVCILKEAARQIAEQKG
jgi:hypothetical protein